MATNANMGGPSVNPFAQALPLTEETTKAMEIKLNQPKPFTGKKGELEKVSPRHELIPIGKQQGIRHQCQEDHVRTIFHERRRHGFLEGTIVRGCNGP